MTNIAYRALAPLVPGALYTFGTPHGGRELGWYVGSYVEDADAEAGTRDHEVLTFDTGYGLTTVNATALIVLRVATAEDIADLRAPRTPMGFAHRVDYLMTWAAAERGVTARAAAEHLGAEALADGVHLADYLETYLSDVTACGAQVLYASTGIGQDDGQLCLPCLMRTIPAGAARAELSSNAYRVSGAGWEAFALTPEELRDLAAQDGKRFLLCSWCGSAGQS